LGIEIRTVALGALGFLAAEEQGFKFVMTLFADVFKNRHDRHSVATRVA
jgi:hypothetical protein